MKIVVFGDINSDYYNLRNMFDQIPKDVDRLVCLGDIVHHNSLLGDMVSDDCISLLSDHEVLSVKGNHEKRLLNEGRIQLSAKNRKYLESSEDIEAINDALFTHDVPFKALFFPTPKENLRYFFGHFHMRMHIGVYGGFTDRNYFPAFDRPYNVNDGTHLINPGTVHGTRFERPSYVIYDGNDIIFKEIKL